MKISQLISILVAVMFSSCSGDFLSVEELNVNIPSSTAPTITSFLCPQDSIHRVTLTYTSPVVGVNKIDEWTTNVSKSIVTLSDGTQTVILKSDSDNNRIFYVKSNVFAVVAGKTYTLHVTMYDGQQAEATCTIPLNRVDISKADTKEVTNTTTNIGGVQEKKYQVTWQDIPNEVNRYAVYVVAERYNFTTREKQVDYDQTEYGINDSGNEGKELSSQSSFSMRTRQDAGGGFRYVSEVQILNVDSHFDKYHQDLQVLKRSADNPKDEPIRIYSNIQGGFGIFAGYTRASGFFY